MTEQDLRKLLEHMYNISLYSDEHISKEQYEYYINRLDAAEKNHVEDTIKDIIFELDIFFPGLGRKIAYPFSFNMEVMKWMRKQIVEIDGKQQYYCVACKCYHDYQHNNVSMALSIDHEPSLSKRFNDGEYKLSRKERCASYNDINRLQIMCQSQNSRKGGERYKENKLMEVFLSEL